MKAIFRNALLFLASLGGTLTAKAQYLPQVNNNSPVTVYGNESHTDQEFRVTLIKPDTMTVDCVILMSGKQAFVFPAKTWVDPTDGSPSEEINLMVPLNKLDFSNPVVVRLLHKRRVVVSYQLDSRSPFGDDYIDFYRKK